MHLKSLSKHGGNGNIGNRRVPTMKTHCGFWEPGSNSLEAPDGYDGQVAFVAAANAIADPNLVTVRCTCDQAEDKLHLYPMNIYE